jgi:glutathione synthase/RimK-type ligase-like ATP-grasp enzyme
VNPQAASDQMESKLRQLQLASELGFDIPRTMVSNRGDEIRAFCKSEGGRIVAKALYAPLIEEPEQDFFVFSNVVTSADLLDNDALSLAPSIFQQMLSPKIDYRVTVIGDNVIAVRIVPIDDARGEATLDWRTREANVKFETSDIPKPIEQLCRDFVTRAGLVFGAIDLVEHAGRFFFLEINPNGEWGWLEKTVGVPISSALCDVLVDGMEQ